MNEKEEMEKKLISKKNSMSMEEKEKLYLPGEKEAIEGKELKIFTLYPQREFTNNAESIHFRYFLKN